MKKKQKRKKRTLQVRLYQKYKIPFFIILVLFLATCAGVIVYAALTDSDTVTNTFRVADVTTEIVEEFDPPKDLIPGKEYKKEAWVKNSGEGDIFVRVLVVAKITKVVDGAVQLLTSDVSKLEMKMSNPADWKDGEDGYYYYLKKLKKGETTTNLIDSVTLKSDVNVDDYKNAQLDLELKVEAINTTPYAYRDAWWERRIPTEDPLKSVELKLASLTSK